MTRTAHILAQLAMALLVLRLFTPIPGIMYVVVALLLTALVFLVASTGVFKRRTREPVAAPPSPQQVMRNTRAELPDEYVEWFDWTAELAGFDLPAPTWRAAPIMIDHSVTKVVYRKPTLHKPTLPTEYRACPDRTCNVSYGPGAGWTHTDQHTWVEMQT